MTFFFQKFRRYSKSFIASCSKTLDTLIISTSKTDDIEGVEEKERPALRFRNEGTVPGITSENHALHETKKSLLSERATVHNVKDKDICLNIHIAASKGWLHVLNNLIERGSNVNQQNDKGFTPIHAAAFSGHLHVVDALTSHGANLNQASQNGRTALHAAATEGHLHVLKYLLEHGADVNISDDENWTPLHAAASEGHLHVLQYLLEHGADVNISDDEKWTPIHAAAQEGHTDNVNCLISHGAEVTIIDNDHWTPLHAAVEEGHLDIVKCLISHGAGVNTMDKKGWTPLHATAKMGHLDIAKYLISQEAKVTTRDGSGRTSLHVAAGEGHLDFTKYLISQGADVNEGSDSGWSALHAAAYNCHLDLVKFLITQGGDVHREKHDGSTPLHEAACSGNLDVVICLISHGANFNKEYKNGWTPLHAAAEDGHLDIVKYFVSQGVDTNIQDEDKWTPLHAASQQGHSDIVDYLLSQGVHMTMEDHQGWTPLHAAAEEGHLDVIKHLISHGVDVNTKDEEGLTPLNSAAAKGHLHITKYLISKGANVNACDRWDKVCHHTSAKNSSPNIAKCLNSRGADDTLLEAEDLSSYRVNDEVCPLFVKNYQSEEVDVKDENMKSKTHLLPATKEAEKIHPATGKFVKTQKPAVHTGDNRGLTPSPITDVKLGAEVGSTPLHATTQEAHQDTAMCLTTHGAGGGMTPIHITTATNTLISKSSDVNQEHLGVVTTDTSLITGVNQGKGGWAPLHAAATEGHLDIVKYLVSHGADLTAGDKEGWTPLHAAAQEGYLNMVKYLLSHGADSNAGDGECWTPLHAAAQEGHLDITKLLISQGANVTKGDKTGWTPLHAAAHEGHTDIVKYLISQGADVTTRDRTGRTPMQVAVQEGYSDIKKYIISLEDGVAANGGAGRRASHIPAHEDRPDLIKYSKPRGAVVPIGDIKVSTCLHAVAHEGHPGITTYLIALTDAVNPCVQGDMTSLLATATESFLAVTIYVISPEGGVAASAGGCMRPLHISTRVDHPHCIQHLISGVAEMSTGDEKVSPLRYTVTVTQGDHRYIEKYIKSFGVDEPSKGGEMWLPVVAIAAEVFPSTTNIHSLKIADVHPPEKGYPYITTYLKSEDKCGKTRDHARVKPLKAAILRVQPCIDKVIIPQEEGLNTGYEKLSPSLYAACQRCHKSLGSTVIEGITSQERHLNIFKGPRIQTHTDSGTAISFPKKSICTDDVSELRNSVRFSKTPTASMKPSSKTGIIFKKTQLLTIKGANNNLTRETPVDVWKKSILLSKHQVTREYRCGSNALPDADEFIRKKQIKHHSFSLSTLVRVLIQVTTVMVVLLKSTPLHVGAVSTPEAFALSEGQNATIPFHVEWPSDDSSVPFYTIGFESKQRPFCIHGTIDQLGFNDKDQEGRFTVTSVTTSHSLSVNLSVHEVRAHDSGIYVYSLVLYDHYDNIHISQKKKIDVYIPPGKVKCLIDLSDSVHRVFEAHCHASAGNGNGTLTCFQDSIMVPNKHGISRHVDIIRGIFFITFNTPFVCCSHDTQFTISKQSCNEFKWPRLDDETQTASSGVDGGYSVQSETTLSTESASSCLWQKQAFTTYLSLIISANLALNSDGHI